MDPGLLRKHQRKAAVFRSPLAMWLLLGAFCLPGFLNMDGKRGPFIIQPLSLPSAFVQSIGERNQLQKKPFHVSRAP